jgi:hypothetical protein
MGGKDRFVDAEGDEQDRNRCCHLAPAMVKQIEALRTEDQDACQQDEGYGDLSEMLPHADSHGGAEPTRDCVDEARLVSAVFR